MGLKQINLLLEKHCQKIINEQGCRVFFASERSSRIWGTAHDTSDYDVELITFCPRSYYYSVKPVSKRSRKWILKPEVTDLPVEVTIRQTDLVTFGQNLFRDDPMAMEILISPMTYICENWEALHQLRELVVKEYSYSLIAKHYYGYSINQTKRLATSRDFSSRITKNLGYISRAIMKSQWVLRARSIRGMPLTLDNLLDATPIREKCEFATEDPRTSLSLPEEHHATIRLIGEALRQGNVGWPPPGSHSLDPSPDELKLISRFWKRIQKPLQSPINSAMRSERKTRNKNLEDWNRVVSSILTQPE